MTSFLALLSVVLIGSGDPVTSVSVLPNLARTEVLIGVTGDVEHRAFQMEGPNRIVLDLMNAEHALPRDDYPDINRGGIVAIRTSQYAEGIVRVVIELEDKVAYTVDRYDGYVRVSLENTAGTFEPWETMALSDGMGVLEQTAQLAVAAPEIAAAPVAQQADRRITVSFDRTPIEDVLFIFAEFSGKSVVPGANVTGSVTADIRDQAWDDAMDAILIGQGLVGTEMENGIIRVENINNLNDREAIEPIITTPYRINFGTAVEVQAVVAPLLSARGQVSAAAATNTVIVMDIARVHEQIASLIASLDVPTPQVMISAKIIFVNRTDLSELGLSYELKDSQGNQLNKLAPGAADLDGDGVIETVQQGTNVVTLGGSSISALGNANSRIAGSTLTLLTSLVVGRHTLVSFIDALQSTNLSDIQAAPSLTVADNQTASIQVGEDTPIRVIDAGAQAGGGAGGSFPRASVQIRPTGIILNATPHITAGGFVLLDISAERSSVDLDRADVGQIFRTQNAQTRVLVRDGETVVIGGLTVTERSEVRSGIPLLMDLPLLGRLFRTQRESEIQRDLMILVTPNIVRTALSN
jgi:type IV pilus assembly protein PilQ